MKLSTYAKRMWTAAAAAVIALLGASRASAGVGSPSFLNIDVTITATVSVAVNGVNSSTHTALAWNTNTANQEFTAGVEASSVTVTNDSNVTEKWLLSAGPTSVNTAGNGTSWTLATSTSPSLPGADKYAVQAVFGSSNTVAGGCPGNGNAAWQNGNFAPVLTTSLQQYTDVFFNDTALNTGGGLSGPDTGAGATSRIKASDKRVLCWRLIMPSSTATVDPQNVQIIVTAQ